MLAVVDSVVIASWIGFAFGWFVRWVPVRGLVVRQGEIENIGSLDSGRGCLIPLINHAGAGVCRL